MIEYLLGLVTIPIGVAAWTLVSWAAGRQYGRGECDVCEADANGRNYWAARGYEPGEVSNLTHWLRSEVHARVYARRRWHRKALGDRWRERESNGWSNRRWNSRYML